MFYFTGFWVNQPTWPDENPLLAELAPKQTCYRHVLVPVGNRQDVGMPISSRNTPLWAGNRSGTLRTFPTSVLPNENIPYPFPKFPGTWELEEHLPHSGNKFMCSYALDTSMYPLSSMIGFVHMNKRSWNLFSKNYSLSNIQKGQRCALYMIWIIIHCIRKICVYHIESGLAYVLSFVSRSKVTPQELN